LADVPRRAEELDSIDVQRITALVPKEVSNRDNASALRIATSGYAATGTDPAGVRFPSETPATSSSEPGSDRQIAEHGHRREQH
jgi:hypothetical protein